MSDDKVVSFLSAVASSAMAPFEALVEIATTGDISNDTGMRVIGGEIADAAGDSLSDGKK